MTPPADTPGPMTPPAGAPRPQAAVGTAGSTAQGTPASAGATGPKEPSGGTPGPANVAGGIRRTPEVERLADRVAQAVRGCPDVAALAHGTVATYLSGRTVAGVAVRDTRVEVSVVVRYGRPLAEIADQVRAAVEPLAPGMPVDVRIDDLEPPAGAPAEAEPAGAEPAGSKRRPERAFDQEPAKRKQSPGPTVEEKSATRERRLEGAAGRNPAPKGPAGDESTGR